MTELLYNFKDQPHLIRTQIISQNYICFVNLKNNFFQKLEQIFITDSVPQRCCNFLISSRIRRFRNSIAHGHWKYRSDFSGFEYWDFEKSSSNSKFNKYENDQHDYNFWHTLSKVVAYSSISAILKESDI